jgi:hypothetical protein
VTVFWDIAPCSLVEVDRRLRGAYFFHHQGLMMEAASTSETSVYFKEAASTSETSVYFKQASWGPDDGGSNHLWNVGIYQWDYTALYTRRLSSSYSPPWEPEMSHEVPTILLNASIHSFHHILCHSTKSSLIYVCDGLWVVAFFSGTIHQHTSVFHATNWSTAWGTVMSHCSRSVSSHYQLQ